MKKNKLVFGFTNLSDSAFETKATTIFTCMTGNLNFPAPVPNLDTVNTAIKNYADALAAAKSRDLVKVIIKNERRAELEAVLISLGHYVTFTANTVDNASQERSIMASSGFNLNASKNNPSQLGAANNFTVQLGDNSGEVIVSVSSVQAAKTYIFFYSPAPVVNNAWLHAINTLPSFVITGLEPGKQYSFKVGVTGARGQVVYTEVITKMVV